MRRLFSGDGERTLRLRDIAAYGSGDIFGAGATVVIGLYFFFFLTENVGFSPLVAGMVFAGGKLIDAITDPLMGYLSDITRSRFGRRRIYFLIGIIPIWITFFLLWLPIGDTPVILQFFFYSICYILFSLVYTLVMVPYSALNAEISRSRQGRMRLAGARMFFALFITLAAVLVPNWLIDLLDIRGYYIMGAFFATLFCAPWLLVFWGTWELPYKHSVESISFREYNRRFFQILKSRTARSHMLMYAASYASIDILMVLAVYYFTYYLGTPQYMYHLTLAVMMLTMIIVLPIYYTLSKRFSIRLLYGCALLIWGSGLVWGYCMMQPGSHWGIILGAGAYLGSGMAGAMMLPWAIFPTVTDIGEYFTGENRAGMYAGVLTLIRKLVQGVLVMPLIAITLYSIGYIPQLFPQAPAVAVGLQRMFFFAPLIFIAIGLIAVIRLPLTQARTAILQETLAKLRSGIQTDRIDAAASKQLNRLL